MTTRSGQGDLYGVSVVALYMLMAVILVLR